MDKYHLLWNLLATSSLILTQLWASVSPITDTSCQKKK